MSEWINTGGWIKVHRSLAEHWLAEHPEKLGWWVLLLLKVAHEDKKVLAGNQLVDIKRGQMIASLSFLAELWNTSKRTAERFVALLEEDKMLSRCVRQKVTILTICNYDDYQVNKNSKCANPCTDDEPIGIQSVSEIKKVKESKEINNTNPAHAREGILWDSSREQGYCNTFKGQGSALPLSKKVGKTPQEVLKLLDVYMALRELKNKGHKDYNEFVNLFLWHVENNKLSLPAEKKEKKVITGQEIFEVYGKTRNDN